MLGSFTGVLLSQQIAESRVEGENSPLAYLHPQSIYG